MAELKQAIRFCASRDGTRIAYAAIGRGPPLVRAPHFLTHLERDLESPMWRPWLVELSRDHTCIRSDPRGCGLSDRNVSDFSIAANVADLEAVADAERLDRFAVFGASQGSAAAIAFAAQFPERVTRLVIYGGFARGLMKRNPTPEEVREARAMLELVEVGWGRENPAYRQMFTSLFVPEATPAQAAWFNELERTCTTPAIAARIIASFGPIDVTDLAPKIRCPTLVLHARNDSRVPFEEGRRVAGLIPGARFVPLEGRNHLLLEGERAFKLMFAELHEFLRPSSAQAASGPLFSDLTSRQREILELVAHGLDNFQIAARLGLSEKTVRNNITPILDKLGVQSRAQAIVHAREAGFASTRLPESR